MPDAMQPPGAPFTPAERVAAEHAALARLALSTWAWPAAKVETPEPTVAEPGPTEAIEAPPATPDEPIVEDSAGSPLLDPPEAIAETSTPPPPAAIAPAPEPAAAEPRKDHWLPSPEAFEAYRAAGGEALVAFVRQQLTTEAGHRRELERRAAMLARVDAVLLRLLPSLVLLALAAVFAVVATRNVRIGATGGVLLLAAAIAIARQARPSFSEEKEAKRLL